MISICKFTSCPFQKRQRRWRDINLSWFEKEQCQNRQDEHSHQKRYCEIGNDGHRHRFDVFADDSSHSEIQRDEYRYRSSRSEKYRSSVIPDGIAYRLSDISCIFLQPDNDSLRNDNQIIDHDSQHQDQSERNDIIEAISDGLEINEISQINDEKWNHNQPWWSESEEQQDDTKDQKRSLPKIFDEQTIGLLDAFFLW